MSLDSCIGAVATKLAGLTGIKEAPAYAKDDMNMYPFAVVYPATGELALQSYNWGKAFHTLAIEIHFNPAVVKLALKQAYPFVEAVQDLFIADPQISNTVSTVQSLTYVFTDLVWSGQFSIGYRFLLTVKLQEST